MTDYPLYQVDAFAERPFTGNPAAVVPLEAWLPDEAMQAIAMEMNLSETAFTVRAEGEADYEIRWFTPTIEVPLCGHATLAAGHVLIEGDRIRFRTRHSGLLEVARAGDAYVLSLPAMRASPRALPEVFAALGCGQRESFWHQQGHALIMLDSEDEVRAIRPDFAALAAAVPILAIVTAPGRQTDVVSRAFAPAGGIDEDPVTGTAHALLAPYWADRLGRDSFTAYQASRRGGRLDCRLEGDRVILGGRCVTVLEGRLRL